MGRTKVKFRRQKHTERQIQDQLEKERQINPSMELPASLTVTQRDQIMVEQRVFQIYQIFSELPHSSKSFMSLSLQPSKQFILNDFCYVFFDGSFWVVQDGASARQSHRVLDQGSQRTQLLFQLPRRQVRAILFIFLLFERLKWNCGLCWWSFTSLMCDVQL